jgi:hypothetical protein
MLATVLATGCGSTPGGPAPHADADADHLPADGRPDGAAEHATDGADDAERERPTLDALMEAGPASDAPAASDAGAPPDARGDTGGPACPGPLIGHYAFEETTGPVVDDSGCGHDGIASAGVIRGVPGIGNAAGFGAPGESVVVPGIDGSLLDGDFTFEAWVRRDLGGSGTIFSFGSVDIPGGLAIWTDAFGQITVTTGNATCNADIPWGTTTEGVTADGWSHVAVDMLRGSTPGLRYFHFYIDGTLALAVVGGQSSLCHGDDDQLVIGAEGPDATLPWQGSIDEAKVWTVSRSRDEICTDAGGVYRATGCDVSTIRPQ